MKARLILCCLCLIWAAPFYAQLTSEGCPSGHIRYYEDNDGDGYGGGEGECYTFKPIGTVMIGGDCNDNDPTKHPGTIWYQDQDGDGLGDPSSTKTQCLQPRDYVLNSSDQCPTQYGLTPTGCPATPPEPGGPVLSNINYVHSITFKEQFTAVPSSYTLSEAQEEVTYLDGLGRPIQNIKIKQAMEGTATDDLITEVTYDSFGRSLRNYLPYARATTTPGTYQALDLTKVRDFYWQKFPADFTSQTATNAYSEKQLESSPLGRVLKQAAPGSTWVMGGGKEIEMDYQANVSGSLAGKVRNYVVSLAGGKSNPAISSPGYYAAGELYKNVTRDENHTSGLNHTTEEFTNKKGQVVLKRTYNNAVAHDTYYVYDDYGNLTYVLSPLTNSTDASPTQVKLDELSYQYRYDAQNRLIEKKIPGKGWEYIVYNQLDQPIMTQDINLRNLNQWLFTKYDAFGRVVYTGLVSRNASRITLQTEANNNTVQYEDRSVARSLGGTTIYYTNSAYPISLISEIHTENYYDTYLASSAQSGIIVPATNTLGEAITTGTKSFPTVSKVRVLGTSNWITTVTAYENKGMPVWSKSINAYLSTTDLVESDIDFIGNVLVSKSTHSRTGHTTITTLDTFTYDQLSSLATHTQSINGGPTELISSNSYDKLRQLKSKGVGNIATSSNRLQKVDYSYNVRGWLKGINNEGGSNSAITMETTDLFGFQINYDKPTVLAKGLFNGNISQTLWKSKNTDQAQRNYLYSYDNLNRLTMAISDDGKFDVGNTQVPISYDKNGNISRLIRKGAVVDNPVYSNSLHFGVMDDLTYTYDNGNKLMKVADAASIDKYGFKDDAVNTTLDSADDYTYDPNGNMKTDTNKGITGITYNHLNLPMVVSIGGGTISYIYDATGVKQRKSLSSGTTTDYAGNYLYQGNTLQFFSHPEGYVENNAGTYKYHYQYKDHLGNIRVSYFNNGSTSTPSVVISEENNYYPFGLLHRGYNYIPNGNGNSAAKKLKFNGVEIEESLGLELYMMDVRNYDPAIGRFTTIDPVTHFSYSTYSAFDNNPIYWADPTGADSESFLKELFDRSENGTTWTNNGNGNFSDGDGNTAQCNDCNGEQIQNDSNPFGDFQVLKKQGWFGKYILGDANGRRWEGPDGVLYSVDDEGFPVDIYSPTIIGGSGSIEFISAGGIGVIMKLPKYLKHLNKIKSTKDLLKYGVKSADVFKLTTKGRYKTVLEGGSYGAGQFFQQLANNGWIYVKSGNVVKLTKNGETIIFRNSKSGQKGYDTLTIPKGYNGRHVDIFFK